MQNYALFLKKRKKIIFFFFSAIGFVADISDFFNCVTFFGYGVFTANFVAFAGFYFGDLTDFAAADFLATTVFFLSALGFLHLIF